MYLVNTIEGVKRIVAAGILIATSSSILPPPPQEGIIKLHRAPIAGAIRNPNIIGGCDSTDGRVAILLDTLRDDGKIDSSRQTEVLASEKLFKKLATGQEWDKDFQQEIDKKEICLPGANNSSGRGKSLIYGRLDIGILNQNSSSKDNAPTITGESAAQFVEDGKGGYKVFIVNLEQLKRASNGDPTARISLVKNAIEHTERAFSGLGTQ